VDPHRARLGDELRERLEPWRNFLEILADLPSIFVRERAPRAAVGGPVEPRFVVVVRLRCEWRIDVDEIRAHAASREKARIVQNITKEKPAVAFALRPLERHGLWGVRGMGLTWPPLSWTPLCWAPPSVGPLEAGVVTHLAFVYPT
jgi:hypothetical protein